MKLLHLRGDFFRNINSLNTSLSSHMNVVHGDNGSGKSTLLEMIYCLSRGRSFRTHLGTPIVQYEQDYCTAFARIYSQSISTTVGFKRNKQGKTELKVGYDDAPPTMRSLSRLLPVQLFHPESHHLLNDGPPLRRKFIDWGLFYKEPHFITVWSRFYQILKQRNAALSQKQPISYIRAWDAQLAEVGSHLSDYRERYVSELVEHAQPWMRRLLGNKVSVRSSYYAGWDRKHALIDMLAHQIDKDLRQGYTVMGPQRFDLLLQLNGLAAEKVLSRGEQKRLICALHLAQGDIFKRVTQADCIYLMDDILSELDTFYQGQVIDALMSLDAQVFFTSLDTNRVQPLLSLDNTKEFHLVKGRLQ